MGGRTGKLEGDPCSQQRKRAKEDKTSSGKPSSSQGKARRDDDQLTSTAQKSSRPSTSSSSRTRRATADQDGDTPSKASASKIRARIPEGKNSDDADRGNKSAKKSRNEPSGEGDAGHLREEVRKAAVCLLRRNNGQMNYSQLHRELSSIRGLDRSMAVRDWS